MENLRNNFDKLWTLAGVEKKLIETSQYDTESANVLKDICFSKIYNLGEQSSSIMEHIWKPISEMGKDGQLNKFEPYEYAEMPSSPDIATVVIGCLFKTWALNYGALLKPVEDAELHNFLFEQNLYNLDLGFREGDTISRHLIYTLGQLMSSYASCMNNLIMYKLMSLVKDDIKKASDDSFIVDLSNIKDNQEHANAMQKVFDSASEKLGKTPTAIFCDDRASKEFEKLQGFEPAEKSDDSDEGLWGHAFESRIPVIKSRTLTYYTDKKFNTEMSKEISLQDNEDSDIGFFILVHRDFNANEAPIVVNDCKAPFIDTEGVAFNNSHQVRYFVKSNYNIESVSDSFASVGAFRVKKWCVLFPRD